MSTRASLSEERLQYPSITPHPILFVITTALTTENWIALFAILIVLFTALGMTLWHQYQEKIRQYAELENAYRTQEKEVSQRTQTLRATNNELYHEISQHELTETKLRQTQQYLNNIIDSMPSILICVTADGVITHWNTRAEEITGYKETTALGQYLWDIYPSLPLDLFIIREAIEHKVPKMKENCKEVRQGEIHYQDITVYPLNSHIQSTQAEAIIQIDDVTVRVMMESRMIQNEKMMSLGELAAGMAHEINNPLGAILQSVQNIERRTTLQLAKNQTVAEESGTTIASIEKYLEKREINKFLRSIKDAGERSTRIVANMLEFSHKSQHHSEVNINELLQHCLELAENNFRIKVGNQKTSIRIQKHFDKSLAKVMCSPVEIQQVLLNLFRNASQCFINPENNSIVDNPTITITTSSKADHCVIQIRDNGPGMAEEVRRHIFEPFFTTKEVGKGTGLGLSISYFIITEHHNGTIEASSTEGGGTEFTITLPLISLPIENNKQLI